MRQSIYVAVPLMLVVSILQTAVLPFFPLFGLIPQIPFLIALSWALLRGVEEGIIWAFVAGFFLDLFSIIPMGVTSLSFVIAIFAVIWIQDAFPSSRFFLPIILGVVSTLVYLVVYAVVLQTLGFLTDFTAVSTLPPLALIHGGLILPVYWILFGIDNVIRPRRVQI
ncbi:MAG: rod shape-determining protein MreD [Chloroflexi bacterium]|nr:rod shape-determining protein MreD [Chloroflexota bacterium]